MYKYFLKSKLKPGWKILGLGNQIKNLGFLNVQSKVVESQPLENSLSMRVNSSSVAACVPVRAEVDDSVSVSSNCSDSVRLDSSAESRGTSLRSLLSGFQRDHANHTTPNVHSPIAKATQ